MITFTPLPRPTLEISQLISKSIATVYQHIYTSSEILCWQKHYEFPSIIAVFRHRYFFGLRDSSGALVGVGAVDLKRSLLCSIYIHPRCMWRGWGRKLVFSLEAFARSRGLQNLFVHSVPQAVAFYQRCGYGKAVHRKIIWDGMTFDEVEMRKSL